LETPPMTTGLVYDPIYLEHRTGNHPERPERLTETMRHFEASGLLGRLRLVKPRAATIEELKMVHEEAMIEAVFAECDSGGGFMDMDTPVSSRSGEAALKAVGGLFEAADRILAGELDNALALVRPPGHHATPSQSMGFCLFNNVALCARHLQKRHRVKKILVVDWDVHHGNGTQEAFYDDPSVLYFSTHRYPFYPGSGSTQETGTGPGTGFTINRPMAAGVKAEEFMRQFREVIEGPAADFRPEFVLISAGFDASVSDPIGAFCLEAPHFAEMTRLVKVLAEGSAKGRIVSALEGGYDLAALPSLIEAHVRALMGEGEAKR
jgi:acetoin utilization deacetylase AcuC-like enzyme